MRHEIEMRIPTTQVVHCDVEFAIRENAQLLGRLKVSKGNIEWDPSGNSANKFTLS